jgi:hypothetical protein
MSKGDTGLDSQPHIFMHLHKTGGTTVMSLLHDHYPPARIYSMNGRDYRRSMMRFKQLSAATRDRFGLIKGHMFFGVHSTLTRPAVYFTMLRHPLSRMLSLYNYLCELRSPSAAGVPDMSLADFVRSGSMLMADNGMARMLAGVDFDEIPYGQCDQSVAARAVDHLQQHFSAVGLTEQFDASLLLFKQCLGWRRLPFYARRNVTRRTALCRDNIDAETAAAVEPYLIWDLAVYDAARNVFETAIAEQGAQFETDLAAFREQNTAYASRLQRPLRRRVRQLRDAVLNRNLVSLPCSLLR